MPQILWREREREKKKKKTIHILVNKKPEQSDGLGSVNSTKFVAQWKSILQQKWYAKASKFRNKLYKVGSLELNMSNHYYTTRFPLAHTCVQVQEWASIMINWEELSQFGLKDSLTQWLQVKIGSLVWGSMKDKD